MRNLTQGNLLKNIILFALPMFFQFLFQTVNQFITMLMVGQLGKAELAGFTIAFPVMYLLIALVIGFSIGTSILIAQCKGAGNQTLLNQAAQNSLVISTLLVIVLSVLGFLLTDPLLLLLHTPEEVWTHARILMHFTFGGLLVMHFFNAIGAIFRGLGDSKTPMYSFVVFVLINLGLVPLFIFVFEWGVGGAVLASLVAYAVVGIPLYLSLYRKPHICDVQFKQFQFNLEAIKKIIYLGLPNGLQQMVLALGGLAILGLVNSFGTDVIAAVGLGNRIDMFVFMPMMALGGAITTIIGQNIGAGKLDRVKKSMINGVLLAIFASCVGMLLIYLFMDAIIQTAFPKVSDYTVIYPIVREYLLVTFITYPLLSTIFVLTSGIRGAGDSIPPLIIVIITQVGVRLPFAFLMADPALLGKSAIWWSQVFSVILGLILCFLYVRFGPWMRRAVVGSAKQHPIPEPGIKLKVHEAELVPEAQNQSGKNIAH